MKSLTAIIGLFLLSNITIAQSQWSIDAGILSIHGPNLVSINYEVEINENVNWHISAGMPAFTTGFSKTYSDNGNSRKRYSGTLGKVLGDAWMIHFSWTKEQEISKQLIWAWGISVPILSMDDFQMESLLTTAGSSEAAQFIPLPILNLRYDF